MTRPRNFDGKLRDEIHHRILDAGVEKTAPAPPPAMTSYRLHAARRVTAEVLSMPGREPGTLKVIRSDYQAYIGTVFGFGANSPFVRRGRLALLNQIAVGKILRFEIRQDPGRFYHLELAEVVAP